jgi:predicted transcriptional regulator
LQEVPPPAPFISLEKRIALKYRTREKIVAEILLSALESSKKTTVMYRSKLTLPQLREYLPLLVEEGLLEFTKETKLYKTTPKGVHAMKVLQHMNALSGWLLTDKQILPEKGGIAPKAVDIHA